MSSRAYAIAAYVALFTAVGAAAPYLPVYYQSLGLGLDQIGLLAALSAALGMISAPLWGAAADHSARSRLVMPTAALLGAVAATGLALLMPPFILLAIALYATASPGIAPILDARALEATADSRNRYGRMRVWGSISFIASTVAAGWLIEQTGIRVLFLILIPALIVTASVGVRLPPRASIPPMPRLAAIAAVLRQRQLTRFLLAILATWSASSAINAFYSIRLLAIGAPESLVGVAWALGAAVEIPLMIGFAWLADRLGTARLIMIGAALMAVRAAVIALVGDPLLVTLTMLLHGGGFALLLVGGVTYVGQHAPRGAAATAQGVLSGVTFGVAMIVGPGIGGPIAGLLGLEATFVVAAVAGATAVVALGWALGHPPGSASSGSSQRTAEDSVR